MFTYVYVDDDVRGARVRCVLKAATQVGRSMQELFREEVRSRENPNYSARMR